MPRLLRLARAALAAAVLLAPPGRGQDGPRVELEGLAGGQGARGLGALEDVSDAGLAFVELVLARDGVLVREPFTLRLRFGFESGFFAANLVQLFQRELDVPAQLHAPWLAALEGALVLAGVEPAGGLRVALDEEVVLALPQREEQRGTRGYRVFELARTFVPTRTGELVFAAPLMRFAHATRFEDDFAEGRRALDRRDALVRGRGARLTVRALPEEGRPADFTGALGRFTLRAEAEPRELAAGQSLVLTVVIEVDGPLGDLAEVEEPRLHELAGFHLRGSLAERELRRLSVRYDLVPAGPAVRVIPPVRFAFFDTTPPAGYRTLTSEPIPITVRAASAEPVRAVASPQDAAPQPELPAIDSGAPPLLVLVLVLALAASLLALLAVLLRARRAPPA